MLVSMSELREKVITLLDDMRLFVDLTVHSIVSPDNWNVYSELCDFIDLTKEAALSLLKAQELPDVKPEKLEERTTKWLDQMTAEERLDEIAAILDDWDGYRTAKGLGGLINEVWAYALYPVKAQEPKFVSDIAEAIIGCKPKVKVGHCPSCGVLMSETDKYCRKCGQAVKWE